MYRRQRMALVRSVSSRDNVENRLKKQITGSAKGMTAHIDGFNTIITLEVALSGSPLLLCSDAIILDRCPGWLNLVPSIVENLRDVWVITF